jgi:hypothetical protein
MFIARIKFLIYNFVVVGGGVVVVGAAVTDWVPIFGRAQLAPPTDRKKLQLRC